MATVGEHYENLLTDVYSWMLGGFETAIRRNVEFFERHGVRPRASGRAIDLGAGCGFQSIPLANAGFDVTAIDFDQRLLEELRRNDETGRVNTVTGDLMCFADHVSGPTEIAVCMTDTLLHLESTDHVRTLFDRLSENMEPGGRFIATFRDLSSPLQGLDRFIPVRSDDSTILTCFLESDDQRIKVHDLLYRRIDGTWKFSKSYYYKLRIAPDRARGWLLAAGFGDVQMTIDSGLATLIATKTEQIMGPE